MRDLLDLKNKTVKRIQDVPRHKYWATSIARWTTSSCNTCRHTSDTNASAVLADPTRALQGTNRGSGPAMEESENDLGSLKQLLLYEDEHYLAAKIAPGRPFRKGPTWGRRISST
ncbi:hypothetical protein TNCV_954651 [Trichonephila clavipes]|nr:hypothetical protein TNCV_954651 [Trichonephila clavipes]